MPITLKEINFKLPAVSLPEPILGSPWLGKLVSPLHAPAFSKEGVAEIADRVKYIGLACIVLLISIAIRWATSGSTKSDSLSKGGKAESNAASKPAKPSARGAPASNSGTRKPPESTKALLKNQGDQAPTIQEDFENLHGHCEILSDDLFGFRRVTTQERETSLDLFGGHLSAFEKKYQDFRNYPANSKLFSDLSKVKTSFLHMSDIAHGIIRVPGDGNCLFSCIREAMDAMSKINDLSAVWKPELNNDQALREHIVKRMREDLEQDPNLKKEIDGAITRFVQDKKAKTLPDLRETLALFQRERKTEEAAATEQAIKALEEDLVKLASASKYDFYFTKINEPGFFAGDAEMYEAAKIFNAGFIVKKEYEGRIVEAEFDTVINGEAPLKITLIYRNDDHFDWQPQEAN